jgi:hypothetical protein
VREKKGETERGKGNSEGKRRGNGKREGEQ